MNNLKRRKFLGRLPFRSVGSLLLAIALSGLLASSTPAQDGRLVRENVHGVSLEKTATGESADRRVSIYLPPGYDSSPNRRYPLIYLPVEETP